jgi:hypothetical protein
LTNIVNLLLFRIYKCDSRTSESISWRPLPVTTQKPARSSEADTPQPVESNLQN